VLGGRVDVFLQQSGLNYTELLDLLDTYYINSIKDGKRTIQIVSTDPDNLDTCETDKLHLDGLDEATAAQIVRFVRLWRKLGWTMRALDAGLITRLSHVQHLHRELNLPVIHLLSWWAPYAQLFHNRAVTNPLDPDFPEDANKLNQTKKLSDQIATSQSH
jgi:hypothetical protein